MHEYAFDLYLCASVRVKAPDEAAARAALNNAFDCADSYFGAWANGEPIVAESSLRTVGQCRPPYLYEIDGETQ